MCTGREAAGMLGFRSVAGETVTVDGLAISRGDEIMTRAGRDATLKEELVAGADGVKLGCADAEMMRLGNAATPAAEGSAHEG